MIGLRNLITLVICTLVFGVSNGFTVVPSVGKVATMSVSNAPTFMTTSTARPVLPVDQAITEMVSRSDPLGAIIMAVLVISLWEVYTPGRVKN
jgi:hypothetical protein